MNEPRFESSRKLGLFLDSKPRNSDVERFWAANLFKSISGFDMRGSRKS